MKLFRGKKFEVKVVDDVPEWERQVIDASQTTPKWIVNSEDINDVVYSTAAAIVVVYSTTRVVDTLCQIAIIAAKAKF